MRLTAHLAVGALLSLVVVAVGCGGAVIGGGGSDGSGGAGTRGSAGAGGSTGSGGGTAGAGGTSGGGGSAGTGGSKGTAGSDGSGGAGGSGGVPIDAGPPVGCPDMEPAAGEGCFDGGFVCEYGDSPNPYCNKLFECKADAVGAVGAWASAPSGGVCPPAGPACPSSWGAVQGMKKCSENDETCAYSEGTCLCTSDPGGLPIEDGPVWQCTPATTDCPSPRPKLGTPCTIPSSTECDYGQCNGGVGEQCVDGYWQLAMAIGCPA
jgi:hypothetical protein